MCPVIDGVCASHLRCSQEDIANRRSMADARSAERAFFESHPEYLEVAPQVNG